MNTARWLLLINLALSFYCVGAVWLVQVTCYPLWAYVGRAEWEAYHLFWWHSIWIVILGLGGLTALAAFAMLKWRPPGIPARAVWLGIALQVALYGLTAVWWAPLMAELTQVSGPVYGPMYHKLLITHWLRVGIVTAYGLLALWMTAVSFQFRQEEFGRDVSDAGPGRGKAAGRAFVGS